MRELTANEIFEVGGADGLNFNSALTMGTLNSVSNATTVTKMAALAFSAGYAFGTWLNQKFNISTNIVDAIIG